MNSRPQDAPNREDAAIANRYENSESQNGSLFPDVELLDGRLNLDDLVRRALSFALSRSQKSRQQIAEELSRAVGSPVTVAMLDGYTAESKRGYRFPASWLVAFCLVTGDTYILRRMAQRCGVQLLCDEEREFADLGRQHYIKLRSEAFIADAMRRIQRREQK